jgi:3-dehydroquinate synthetase
LIELMGSDKKTRGGQLRFVLTPRIGKARTYEARDLKKLELVLRMTERVAEAEPMLPKGASREWRAKKKT